ncbi:MAG: Smr/MutS family protein, partial [Candidatus Poribacteria bacterium]|nr:Smr/MutS family protein [Candidatus Poribacteria bacterium]
NLIGQKVAPALETVDKYLDDAYLAGLLEVRLIHGKGTGALGSAIHDFLRTHLLVTHFSFATVNQGGSGATQVKLKE